MKIEYSKTADALYVSFREVEVARSREIEEGVVLDFDKENQLVGVEILDASHRLKPGELASVKVTNLSIESV